MDYPKFIVSNQKEESIGIQRVTLFRLMEFFYKATFNKVRIMIKDNVIFLSVDRFCSRKQCKPINYEMHFIRFFTVCKKYLIKGFQYSMG